jgi:hypothetical protein
VPLFASTMAMNNTIFFTPPSTTSQLRFSNGQHANFILEVTQRVQSTVLFPLKAPTNGSKLSSVTLKENSFYSFRLIPNDVI